MLDVARNTWSRCWLAACTLVELVAVMGIIAVQVCLLLPVVYHARARQATPIDNPSLRLRFSPSTAPVRTGWQMRTRSTRHRIAAHSSLE